MEILPLDEDLLVHAAELFVSQLKQQRQAVPALPGDMEDPAQAAARLKSLVARRQAIAAVDQGRLLGYLSWYIVDDFREFLQQPNNSVWIAQTGADAVGFMRFEGQSHGATEIVQSPVTIAITGAYTRPAFRDLGAAPALLDAALKHYAALGFTRCSVDFESFNPEAARFWPKYFDPVVFSLMRRPETL